MNIWVAILGHMRTLYSFILKLYLVYMFICLFVIFFITLQWHITGYSKKASYCNVTRTEALVDTWSWTIASTRTFIIFIFIYLHIWTSMDFLYNSDQMFNSNQMRLRLTSQIFDLVSPQSFLCFRFELVIFWESIYGQILTLWQRQPGFGLNHSGI